VAGSDGATEFINSTTPNHNNTNNNNQPQQQHEQDPSQNRNDIKKLETTNMLWLPHITNPAEQHEIRKEAELVLAMQCAVEFKAILGSMARAADPGRLAELAAKKDRYNLKSNQIGTPTKKQNTQNNNNKKRRQSRRKKRRSCSTRS